MAVYSCKLSPRARNFGCWITIHHSPRFAPAWVSEVTLKYSLLKHEIDVKPPANFSPRTYLLHSGHLLVSSVKNKGCLALSLVFSGEWIFLARKNQVTQERVPWITHGLTGCLAAKCLPMSNTSHSGHYFTNLSSAIGHIFSYAWAKREAFCLAMLSEFDEYLECGRLEHGFFVSVATERHHEHLVAFSCKRRGFCPSCGARRMVETAALLVDDVLPHKPIRQWVLSSPYSLRFLLASNPQVVSKVLGIVNRVISTHLIKKTGFKKATAHTGAVSLLQRLGLTLNLNLHLHVLFIDGVYQQKNNGELRLHCVNAPTANELIRWLRRWASALPSI